MSLKGWLYKLAVRYIGKCNQKWYNNYRIQYVKELKRLTCRNGDKAYLVYGADAEWKNFSSYEVLDYAIQKLAMYEDQELTQFCCEEDTKVDVAEYIEKVYGITLLDFQKEFVRKAYEAVKNDGQIVCIPPSRDSRFNFELLHAMVTIMVERERGLLKRRTI